MALSGKAKKAIKPVSKKSVKAKPAASKQKSVKRPSEPSKKTSKAAPAKPLKGKASGRPAVKSKSPAVKKADTKTALNKQAPENNRFADLKKLILAKREAILNGAKQEIAKYMNGEHRQLIDTAIDEGDWATIDISEDLNLKRLSAQRQTLLDIEECLRKINDGTYGICEECGEEISIKRLNVLPTATLCIDCKENMERMAAFTQESEL